MTTLREVPREIINENTDCDSCRLISAAGLGVGGMFLIHHRNNFGKINSYIQTFMGMGLFILASLRALDLPPFGLDKITGRNRDEYYVPKDSTITETFEKN